MQKFEYKHFIVKQKNDSVIEELNKLGSEGWEIISVSKDDRSRSNDYFFKRPVADAKARLDE